METIKQRDELIDQSINDFNAGLIDVQKKLYKLSIAFLKELETDKDGNVKPTAANLKAVNIFVKKKLKAELQNGKYADLVEQYLKSFDKAASLTDKYFKEIGD